MTITLCDRCHHIINEKLTDEKYVVLSIKESNATIRSIDGRNHKRLELCSNCARSLAEFIECYVAAD